MLRPQMISRLLSTMLTLRRFSSIQAPLTPTTKYHRKMRHSTATLIHKRPIIKRRKIKNTIPRVLRRIRPSTLNRRHTRRHIRLNRHPSNRTLNTRIKPQRLGHIISNHFKIKNRIIQARRRRHPQHLSLITPRHTSPTINPTEVLLIIRNIRSIRPKHQPHQSSQHRRTRRRPRSRNRRRTHPQRHPQRLPPSNPRNSRRYVPRPGPNSSTRHNTSRNRRR